MPELEQLERGWDQAARENAFFNIITIPGLSEEQFWAMGRREIDDLMTHIADGEIETSRALDFGCGVGRITQALAHWFERVDGVDISTEMVRLAREHNRFGARIRYHHNPAADLKLFEDDTFDLTYTVITLQHMSVGLQRGYIWEFLRVTKPGGLAVFQAPDFRAGYAGHHEKDWLSMWATPREMVDSWLVGGELLEVRQNDAAGPDVTSNQYIVKVT